MVSPWNNVVIRQGGTIDRSSLFSGAVSAVGSRSGGHSGDLRLSTDATSLIFLPDRPFELGEQVVVRLERGVRTTAGEALQPLTFSFSVASTDPKRQPRRGLEHDFPELTRYFSASESAVPVPQTNALACDTLPAGYPSITVLGTNNPSPGSLFMAPFGFAAAGPLLILDNLGKPIFYRKLPGNKTALDFNRQSSGLLTYFAASGVSGSGTNPNDKYYGLNSAYTVVDSFFTGNGYVTDIHDLVVLPNGHALLMSYDPQHVRMDTVVTGGNPNAIVTGLIVQEIDAAKNVVFQWRSWDHFLITDMIEQTGSLTDSLIDYVHGNAVAPDLDGNILISARHMNEITKISRTTGNIIWRLGRNAKHNDFTFVNDTRGFSHQHDVRRLPNGHLTLFDNGNFLNPQYSRAVEYALNEVSMTATQVWEYRNSPDTYGGFMGSVQRLADGGTFIGWGGTSVAPGMTEVRPAGGEALEIGFAPARFSYRARKYEWQTTLFETDVESLAFGTVALGSTGSAMLTVHNNSVSSVTITCFAASDPQFAVTDVVPLTIPGGGSAAVNARFTPTAAGQVSANLYVRSVRSDEIVAQVVGVTATGAGTLPAVGPWGLAILGSLVVMLGVVRLRGAGDLGRG